MCGIFGFCGSFEADPESLERVASLAATRGPHSHGFAWPDDSRIVTHRGMGDLNVALPLLRSMPTSCIIGHSRLATTGTYAGGSPRLEDTAPFTSDNFAVVHNGNVRSHRAISARYGFELTTGCDSEVIVHLLQHMYEQAPGLSLATLLSIASDAVDEGRPFVIVAMSAFGEVAATRRGLPLWVANADEGMYLCSRKPDLDDASVERVPEETVWGYPGWVARRVS